MKILDTNLWIFGTLGTNDRAEQLLDDIERGETMSVINAYMVQGALDAFDRTPGLAAAERDELKTLFLTRLTRMLDSLKLRRVAISPTHRLTNVGRMFTFASLLACCRFSRKMTRFSF